MDDQRFDALTRALAVGLSRRRVLKGLIGGVAGGVAVANRLERAGAQPVSECTPETVEQDCPAPNACAYVYCIHIGGDDRCQYNNLCDSCQTCNEATRVCEPRCPDPCYPCSVDTGQCMPICTDPCRPCNAATGQCVQVLCTDPCHYCSGGACQDGCPGQLCCGGEYCAEECCDASDCYPGATPCSQFDCVDGLCVALECPSGQQCCEVAGTAPYCAVCCDTSDCGPCEICGVDGQCGGACSQREECCNGKCVPFDTCCQSVGDECGLQDVSEASHSMQLDCCDGLLCCGRGEHRVCAECCHDRDCAGGGFCRGGSCDYPEGCQDDWDCPHATCCCGDGSCSGACCHDHPRPPKPGPPTPASPPDTTVSLLPATGAGEAADTPTGLTGAALLGAAAYLAAKKLRASAEPAAED